MFHLDSFLGSNITNISMWVKASSKKRSRLWFMSEKQDWGALRLLKSILPNYVLAPNWHNKIPRAVSPIRYFLHTLTLSTSVLITSTFVWGRKGNHRNLPLEIQLCYLLLNILRKVYNYTQSETQFWLEKTLVWAVKAEEQDHIHLQRR